MAQRSKQDKVLQSRKSERSEVRGRNVELLVAFTVSTVVGEEKIGAKGDNHLAALVTPCLLFMFDVTRELSRRKQWKMQEKLTLKLRDSTLSPNHTQPSASILN